jgi:MFS family permease
VAGDITIGKRAISPRATLLPLALAQFICSFAGSNMNVMINDISKDLDTTVKGVQTTITMFLLVMAALMIAGSKLTDRWGRKRCFVLGLSVYGVGALASAIAPGIGILFLGNSIFEGVGSALLIPPVYILTTLMFTDLTSRARAFGLISGMGGVGAATGPLIGVTILFLSRSIVDPLEPDPTRPFDLVGAILSALGMVFVVVGILEADTNLFLTAVFIALGGAFLVWFFLYIRSVERAGKEPLLSTSLFRNRLSNLGLVTQNVQWLMLLGVSFVVSVFLQIVRGYNAIETGLVFTSATAGILVSSLAAERLARKYAQRTLIVAGFIGTIAGIVLLVASVRVSPSVFAFPPGLLLIGLGVGIMLTPSVNLVQSAFAEERQGEISGVSRSISNLGSSLGTAIAGTILVAAVSSGNRAYVYAMLTLAFIGLIGLAAAWLLPGNPVEQKT